VPFCDFQPISQGDVTRIMYVCKEKIFTINKITSEHDIPSSIPSSRQPVLFLCHLFLLGLLLIISGCNRDNAEAERQAARDRAAASLLSNVVMLNVDMYDSYYGNEDTNMTAPPVWTVQSGADVIVNIVNHGLLDHNWAVVKPGVVIPVPYEEGQAGDIVLHGVGMVYNNSQTTITFTAPESGEYQVICTVSGHYPFMQGKLQVVDGE
jgi:uncharacterized cupredoxin-like copper-binding protein